MGGVWMQMTAQSLPRRFSDDKCPGGTKFLRHRAIYLPLSMNTRLRLHSRVHFGLHVLLIRAQYVGFPFFHSSTRVDRIDRNQLPRRYSNASPAPARDGTCRTPQH